MYKFNLQSLLNHRIFIEESLQKEFFIFKKLLADEKKKLKSYELIRKRSLIELRQKQKNSITISENLIYHNFIDRISVDFNKQKEIVLDIEKKLDQKREDLIEAMKERKTLEKLKENYFKAYNTNLLKNEQNTLNELAINMFNRERLQNE